MKIEITFAGSTEELEKVFEFAAQQIVVDKKVYFSLENLKLRNLQLQAYNLQSATYDFSGGRKTVIFTYFQHD